ncbi:SDR family NAD(P)-dependent oxidoreductase [Candidatus Litorirhabdus singularis]|uniref:SDR family NAD(P)-dependent oxidoreductase n=1 Tax=Candidatus Litorirhabdus singularis TaxID=2518993 RepID=UPI002431202C|nr:SDR family NAD(P)-dependent oxidoreductase [Candidatus Litorirhabdus singularis]
MNTLQRRQFLLRLAILGSATALPSQLLASITSAKPQRSAFDEDTTATMVLEGIDLSGKTYAITGANSGLGYETMRVLTQHGARVIAIARSQKKAEQAVASISGDAIPAVLDLGKFDTIVDCAQSIRQLNTPLDGLICNAGIMALPQRELLYGIEKQFVVNHLGHFILINQLQEQVVAAPAGRFVILSSLAHQRAPATGIQFDDLALEKSEYDAWGAYGHSKLANALCSRELARRLNGTSATSNSVHPGVINTNLGRHLPWYMRVGGAMFGWTFMKTVEQGAATQTYVAAHPQMKGINGYYFADCNIDPGETPSMQDDAMASQLWEVSERLTREWLPSKTA